MPEREFELYLTLLSRFLRLQPAQREEIADELRDHLEARLEALAARGLSRAEAIRTALDEFGDAAELAQHFTHVAHIRQRRLIMRVTFGTVAALATALLVAAAFWPESPQAPAPRLAVAQVRPPAAGPAPKKPATEVPVAAEDEEKAAVETKLSKKIGKVDFEETPLNEVLDFLSEAIDVDILFMNRKALAENGIPTDGPVNLHIKRANLTARVALDLVLEPLELSYTIRDGLIMVTTAAEANQIQVYNVRDLLPNLLMMPHTAGLPGGGPGSGMMLSSSPAAGPVAIFRFAQAGQAAGGTGGGGFIGPGGGMPGMPPGVGGAGGMGGGGPAVVRESNSLAEVIAMTIDPASWDSEGGNGSIVQYQELLVVKNSQTVHGKIKSLLEMMRTSARNPPPGGAGPAVGGLPIVPPAGDPAFGLPAGVAGGASEVPAFKPAPAAKKPFQSTPASGF